MHCFLVRVVQTIKYLFTHKNCLLFYENFAELNFTKIASMGKLFATYLP